MTRKSGEVIDLTNRVFGRLTVICQEGRGNAGQLKWRCRCACGEVCWKYGYKLRQGKAKSCGCLHPGHHTITHGYARLTLERLRAVLDYDPETGLFRWKESRSWRRSAGDIAGNIQVDGYRIICIDGSFYRACRLAWMFVHGAMPAELIDHKNGKRADDRIANLRDASPSENARNSAGFAQSGLKGAYFNKATGRWFSNIHKHGRTVSLGTFDTAQQAHDAWVIAAREQYGEFAQPRHRHAA